METIVRAKKRIKSESRTNKKSAAKRKTSKKKRPSSFAVGVGLALCRAAKEARRIARMYGTPIYVWENGRVVAKKP